MKMLLIATTFLISLQAAAAKFDFAQLPTDQVLNCSGADTLSREPLGIQIAIGPKPQVKGESRKMVYAFIEQTNPPTTFGALSDVIGIKSISNKSELSAVLKTYLSGLLDDEIITQLGEGPANYPLSMIVGKKVDQDENTSKVLGTFMSVTISGVIGTDADGGPLEGNFSFLTYRPEVKSNGTAELMSAGFQTCELLAMKKTTVGSHTEHLR